MISPPAATAILRLDGRFKLSRSLCYFVAAVISISILAVGIVELLYIFQVKPTLKLDLDLQEKYLPAFTEDQLFLARSELFKSGPLEKKAEPADAGVFLNEKVYWTPLKSGVWKAQKPLVSLDIREALLRFRGEWIKKFDRARTLSGDLSVFQGLGRFDYWDLERGSPISEIISRHAFVPPPLLPLPESSDLLAVSKLRLMNGALKAEYIPALNDVRQLARLLLSTENSQMILTGLVILDYERIGYQYFVEEKNLDPKSWVPIDHNVTRRAHRAVLATRNFLHLWTPLHRLDEIFLGATSPISFCSAVNDAYPLEYSLRSRLEPHWPLEASYRLQYQKFDKILKRARSDCRLRYIGDLIDNNAIHFRVPGPLILTRLPYARKVFALRTSVVKFGGFTPYELIDQ